MTFLEEIDVPPEETNSSKKPPAPITRCTDKKPKSDKVFPRTDLSEEGRDTTNKKLVEIAKQFDKLESPSGTEVVTVLQVLFTAAIKAVLLPTKRGEDRSAKKYAAMYGVGRVYVERAMMLVRDFPDRCLMVMTGQRAAISLEDVVKWVRADYPAWKKWGERKSKPRTKIGTRKADIETALKEELESSDANREELHAEIAIERGLRHQSISRLRQLVEWLRTEFESNPNDFPNSFAEFHDALVRFEAAEGEAK